MSRFIIMTIVFAWLAVQAAQAQPVNIPDPNLKSCIEGFLGVTDPNADEMKQLTFLSCTHRGISDLTGLEHADNLQSLRLDDNQISDLSPLSGLTNMTNLGTLAHISNTGEVLR